MDTENKAYCLSKENVFNVVLLVIVIHPRLNVTTGGGVPLRLGRLQRPRGQEGPAGPRPGSDPEASPAHQRQALQDGAAPGLRCSDCRMV